MRGGTIKRPAEYALSKMVFMPKERYYADYHLSGASSFACPGGY